MTVTRKILVFFLLAATTATQALHAGPAAGFAGSFLRMGISARSMAMGSGFTALIDRSFPGYFNPAGVALIESRQIGFTYHSLSLDRQLNITAFSTPLPPNGGLGIGWVHAGVKNIEGRNSAGERTSTMSAGENAFYFTFAQSIRPWLAVGINVKLFYQQLPLNADELSGKGTGFDIGFILTPKKFMPLAFVIQDMNAGYQWNTTKLFDGGRTYRDAFPVQIRVGTYRRFEKLLVTGDGGVITDNKYAREFSFRLGAEYVFRNTYFIRGGIGRNRIAFGTGLNYDLLKENDTWIDYAAVLEFPVGLAHVITFSIAF